MSRIRRLYVALILDLALVAGEIVFSRFAHSTGLFADAAHNLADAVALLLALGAVGLAHRAPSGRRSFGFLRATILSALANVMFLLLSCVAIAALGIDRLLHPHVIDGGLVAIVAGVAVILNGIGAFALSDHSSDLNMRSVRLHLSGDALASAAMAVVGLIVLVVHGAYVLDPIASLAIAALIAFEGWGIARSSVEVLLEASPEDVDLAELVSVMTSVPGVAGVHDLHVWSLSSEVRAASAHLLLDGQPSLEEARAVAQHVREELESRFSITHATLEVESELCTEDGEAICSIETIVPMSQPTTDAELTWPRSS